MHIASHLHVFHDTLACSNKISMYSTVSTNTLMSKATACTQLLAHHHCEGDKYRPGSQKLMRSHPLAPAPGFQCLQSQHALQCMAQEKFA